MKKGEKKAKQIQTFLKQYGLVGFLFFIAVFLTFLMAMTGNQSQEDYQIEVGTISKKQILAPQEVENTIATERRKEQVKNSVETLFKQDLEVEERVLSDINRFFEAVAQTRAFDDEKESLEFLRKRSPVFLTEDQNRLAILLSYAQRIELQEVSLEIAQRILDAGIKEEAITKNILDVKDEFAQSELSLELQILGYHIVSSVLRPNMVKDEEATQEEMMKRVATVEPVKILAGQKIVGEGELITVETYEILKSLNMVEQEQEKQYSSMIGLAILILLILGIYAYYVFSFYYHIFQEKKEVLLIFFIYVGVISLVWLMSSLSFYLIPITIGTMLIAILINVQLGMATNLVMTLVAALIYNGDMNFILFFLIGGSISSLLIKQTVRRNKILRVGILVILMNSLIILGVETFLLKTYHPDIITHLLYGLLNGGLSIIITIGSLPFWEVAFDVITPIKLLDLTNPDQVLLRRLSLEAPGTYHHSLLVANLSETAAADIGANSLVARVGSYYHDIGKLVYPAYFKENQMGENPHDFLDPELSAQIILQHVKDGMQLANTHKLPKVIKDIIQQHQGTTMIKYFYYQAMKQQNGQVEEEQFRYPGPKPQSPEAAIVMLADTIEAAVRALPVEKQNEADIMDFMQVLIQDKLDDGQLEESNLKIKDLQTIKNSFMTVFNGIYHRRIEYPKIKNKVDEDVKEKKDQEIEKDEESDLEIEEKVELLENPKSQLQEELKSELQVESQIVKKEKLHDDLDRE